MNFVKIILSTLSIYIGINGIIIYFFDNYLPNVIKQTFSYGKCNINMRSQFISKLELPKKCFRHFYIFTAPIAIYSLITLIYKYFYNENIPEIVYLILDFLMGHKRKPLVSMPQTILAMFLVTTHLIRRIFETIKINIFSDVKINIFHYLVAYFHYVSFVAAILGESEGLVRGFEKMSRDSLKTKDWIAALIFLWMSYQQLQTNIILANLRKNKDGVVVTKEHKIPRGGLFDYISAPLQFTEIGMYMAVQLIICENKTYFILCIWVVINQFISGLLSHKWHKNTFKDYPPSRKIIIPYLL
ncbi:polyprenol reductase-like [Leptopilina heterotoma]|uniref:polyprenol reductase-like n=1 Tax=Leptopilina heterotoma TaxID=63436 RepID=UPI001CA84B7C|nr:polyprenol reductase-like [Leptopilina heterotoma]